MTAKWSIWRVFRDHSRTLVDARFDPPKRRLGDVIGFYVFPVALGVTCWVFDVQVRGMEAMLSAVSIYAALLFGLLVQVFQIKIRLVDQKPRNVDALEVNRQLEANISYAVLFGIITTVVLLITIAITEKDKAADAALSALIVALLVHLIMTLFMILKRARSIYQHL